MLKVGLTGGIGCGKSTVTRLFLALDVPVLDADEISRQLVEPGQPALERITEIFGPEVLSCGHLDRARLRTIVFNSPEQKQRLEGILHPLIFDEMRRRVQRLETPYCILAIPLLLESKKTDFVDRVLVVDCSVDLQYDRVKLRDALEDDTIARIMASQVSREERIAEADDLIENNGDLESLKAKVDALHHIYVRLAGATASAKSQPVGNFPGTSA